jgi:hypothetical protein
VTLRRGSVRPVPGPPARVGRRPPRQASPAGDPGPAAWGVKGAERELVTVTPAPAPVTVTVTLACAFSDWHWQPRLTRAGTTETLTQSAGTMTWKPSHVREYETSTETESRAREPNP